MLDDIFFTEYLFSKAESTKKTYRLALLRFSAWLHNTNQTIQECTRFDLQEYLSYCLYEKKWTPETIRREFAAIRLYLAYLEKENLLRDIALPKQSHLAISPKSLDKNERNRIFRAVEKSGKVRDTAIIYLLYETGIRAHELVQLNRDDIELTYRATQSRVIIRSGKGNKYRTIPFPKESNAKYWLEEYLKERYDSNEALFLSNYRLRLSQRSLNRILHEYGIHPHLLRHTMLSQLARNGVDLVTVASIAGHTNLQTTQRYTMPREEELQEAMNRAFHRE